MIWFAMVVFVANFLSVQQCASRPIAHAPRSRLHKLDCKVSRQKVLAASEAGGTAIVIGADLRGGDEDQWKYLFSQKMSALQKVIVEASPDLFKQLQTFLSKQSIANATAIQAVIVPSNNYKDKVSTHEIDIFCSNRYAHNSSLSRQSKQRAFCSLNSQHRRFAGANQLFNQSVSSAVFPKSSDDSGGGDKTGVWRVAVPAMSFSQLSGEIKNEDASTVRLVAIDLDEKDTDFQLLHDLLSNNDSQDRFNPDVISVNFGAFSQEQFEIILNKLHQMQYLTCVAKKRKGHHLHAFFQPALLKLKGVQFI